MLIFIDEILKCFESCFSRKAAFHWFVTITMGLMLRSDQLGVTSVIRDLALRPGCYETMLHFFRASSWSVAELRQRWFEIVLCHAPLYKVNGLTILIGDGVKQAKEGRFMPGVKKLFQESENSSKPEYIFGHMFGGLGVLAGDITKWFCIPLSLLLHDGLQPASSWEKSNISTVSHVVQMIENGYQAAKTFGDSLFLLDRYFLSVPGLKRLNELNASGSARMDLVTKAKKSCIAYELPPARKPGRGRPAIKGSSVKLKELFTTASEQFKETTAILYGKCEAIRYYHVDLLWGQKLYQPLRFVLVEYNGVQSILVSTNLNLEPLTIIRLYSYRFRIECMFRELKQQLGAFCYHFWTKYMPKLNRYQKKSDPHPLDLVTNPKAREKILAAVRAVEAHMALSCVAMGILQMISLRMKGEISPFKIRYMRTPSKATVSEATVMYYLRKHIFRIMAENPELSITQIIQQEQDKSGIYNGLQAS